MTSDSLSTLTRSYYVDGLGHGTNPIPAATRRGPLVITSNMFGHDRATGSVPDEPKDEFALAFDNLDTALVAAGSAAGAVLRVDVTMGTEDHRAHLNDAWTALFPDPATRPTRNVTFGKLPPGCNVYISAVAFDAG